MRAIFDCPNYWWIFPLRTENAEQWTLDTGLWKGVQEIRIVGGACLKAIPFSCGHRLVKVEASRLQQDYRLVVRRSFGCRLVPRIPETGRVCSHTLISFVQCFKPVQKPLPRRITALFQAASIGSRIAHLLTERDTDAATPAVRPSWSLEEPQLHDPVRLVPRRDVRSGAGEASATQILEVNKPVPSLVDRCLVRTPRSMASHDTASNVAFASCNVLVLTTPAGLEAEQ